MDMALKEDEQQQRQQQKRLKTSENPPSAPPLPPEIIFDILTRLPVESLLRLRSVCKLWCSIISDPHFVKSHLTNFSTTNIKLIFRTVQRTSLKSYPLYDVLYDGSINNAFKLYCHPLKYIDSIKGSCNGLLLIANFDKDLFIWNPITRRSIRLPNCGSRGRIGWYQFGYDESTDDYKAVAIFYVLLGQFRFEMIVNIYSLKLGHWKRIDDSRNGFPFNFSVKYLNGVLYWRAGQNSDSWKILSLDLAKETYAEILQPVYDEGHTTLTLGVFGGWLCALCDYGRIRADVWVMKVKDSWTKLVSIPYMNDLMLYQIPVPLCISNDGKVLLQLESRFESKLVMCDSKICSVSVIQNFNEYLEAFTFVESLVSPAGPRDNNQG